VIGSLALKWSSIREAHGRESNSQPVDHKSDALTTHQEANLYVLCSQKAKNQIHTASRASCLLLSYKPMKTQLAMNSV